MSRWVELQGVYYDDELEELGVMDIFYRNIFVDISQVVLISENGVKIDSVEKGCQIILKNGEYFVVMHSYNELKSMIMG
jgi:hypothetical protein